MPLPQINAPTYELTIPSSKRKIRYRPFLVKEEKILVIAMESNDIGDIARAVKQVLGQCILTKGIKIDKLSTFDIEYLFLNVRGKSVGETVDIQVTCPDDGVTNVPVTVDLDAIGVTFDPDHDKDIILDDKLKMRMKYPSLDEFIKDNFQVDNVGFEQSIEMIASCVEMIFSEDETWTGSDFTQKEMVDFLEGLGSKQFKELEKFFTTMPKLTHEITVTNPKTKKESTVKLEGLAAFFN
jgi:hypothetical protein|tara:strand:+ start:333 stop:1049 length:717 start_codon:yes stop_codon:yes gene_type:complete